MQYRLGPSYIAIFIPLISGGGTIANTKHVSGESIQLNQV